MPTGGIREILWIPQTAVAVTQSPFSFAQQVQKHPGQRRSVKVKLAGMDATTAREWIGFFLNLNGPERTFFLSDTVGQNETKWRGTPQVDGAGQTGKSLNYSDGATSSLMISAGEWVSIGNRLHQATEDATSDGSGDGTLKLWPELASAPNDDSPIEVTAPKGTFRLTEIPSYSWSVNRLMQGVSFTATEVVQQGVLDYLAIDAVMALSTTRNLYGVFSGPRYAGTSKIYDQSGNDLYAFPNAAGVAPTLETDLSWLFPTSGTKTMLNFGSPAKSAGDIPDNHTMLCVIETSANYQMMMSRGSTANDWFGAMQSGSTTNPQSGVTVGDYRVDGVVVSPKKKDEMYDVIGAAGKCVFSTESVDFTEMSGTLAFGVQHGTWGFKGKLWELIICPDLSADLRDSLIADMIAAHSIT
jgi:hypothetical protein